MSHHNHRHNGSTGQSPEEIENEIEQTRREMDYTLGQIQRKLSPGQMVDEGIAYLRNSGGGDFASNFGVTVKNNPMPIALLSVGLAWLMMAGKNPPSRFSAERLTERFSTERYPNVYAAPESPAWTEDESSGSGPGIRERVGRALRSFGGKASDAGDEVGATVHNVGDRVSNYASGARDSASQLAANADQLASDTRDSASRLASSAGQLASGARDSASHLASRARQRAMRAADAARVQYGRARSSAEHVAHEQPLVLGALGVALGAAIGACLPATRREDELMGSVRDDLVQTGREQYQEARATVEEVAQKTSDTLKEAAQKTREELSSSSSSRPAGG